MDAILEDQQSKGGEDSTDKLLRNAAKDIVEYDFEEKTKELKEFKAKAKALKTILVSVIEFFGGVGFSFLPHTLPISLRCAR